MQEGVDLKGDLSRFQVICKVPYPYLGDKVVKKRMHKWRWWYDYETLKTVVQSIGRSIRSEDDHAITYILDDDWYRFASKHKQSLPENLKGTV
jgi:Rad3-related DNA helicase